MTEIKMRFCSEVHIERIPLSSVGLLRGGKWNIGKTLSEISVEENAVEKKDDFGKIVYFHDIWNIFGLTNKSLKYIMLYVNNIPENKTVWC